MVETLNFGIDKVIIWILAFIGNIILISIFSKRVKLSIKNVIGHMAVAGIVIGLYIAHVRIIEQEWYLYLVLNFIFIHMLFKNRLWEFLLTQAIYYINFTFWWVIFDYIGNKLDIKIIRNLTVPAICAIVVCIIITKVFKSTLLYYRDKTVYEKLSWYQSTFYSFVGIAIILIANMGIKAYRQGIKVDGGDIKPLLIIYIALIGSLIFYIKGHKMLVRQYEKKEEELVHSFSNQQLEAYKRLVRLERAGEIEKKAVGSEVTKLMGLVEKEQIEYVQPYVEALQEQLIIEENNILTGNTIVDVIMNEKYKVACEKHILISINISVPEVLGISVEDLCLIVGNSIDYALEACEKITLGKGRKVRIKGVWYKGYIIFKIWFSKSRNSDIEKLSNTAETKFAIENDAYGLGAVYKVLQKYDGNLEFYTEGKWHKLELCFNTVNK